MTIYKLSYWTIIEAEKKSLSVQAKARIAEKQKGIQFENSKPVGHRALIETRLNNILIDHNSRIIIATQKHDIDSPERYGAIEACRRNTVNTLKDLFDEYKK